MRKGLYYAVKSLKNITVVGFLLAFLLPVEEDVPFGFMAAFVSLAEAIEENSLWYALGFLPNILVSFLVFRAHKTKNWNFIFLLIYTALTCFGALIWLNFPDVDHYYFWEADLERAQFKLKIGYWLWLLSIVLFSFFTLLEKLLHQNPKFNNIQTKEEEL